MSDGFVATKSSLARQSKDVQFEEVVFTSHKKKKREVPAEVLERKKNAMPQPIPKNEESQRFLKKAKHEVIRFGMTGFDGAKKIETKQALAISLGAKPKKNKHINYKEFKLMRAKQKAEEKEKETFRNLGKTSTGQALARMKNRMKLNKEKPKGGSKGSFLGGYGRVKKQDVPTK